VIELTRDGRMMRSPSAEARGLLGWLRLMGRRRAIVARIKDTIASRRASSSIRRERSSDPWQAAVIDSDPDREFLAGS